MEDWDSIGDHIQYDFLYDNQFAELKESEMLNERLGILGNNRTIYWKILFQ